jgi:hypothetical protein
MRLMAYPKAYFIENQALLTVGVIAHSSKTLAFSKPLDMASDCGWRGSDVFPDQPLQYCARYVWKDFQAESRGLLIIKLSAGLADIYIEPNWCFDRG